MYTYGAMLSAAAAASAAAAGNISVPAATAALNGEADEQAITSLSTATRSGRVRPFGLRKVKTQSGEVKKEGLGSRRPYDTQG